MSKPVRLAREARAEMLEAAQRYGRERPELRLEFLSAVDEALERLVRLAPHLGSPPGIDPTSGVKRIFIEALPVLDLLCRASNAFPGAGGRARSTTSLFLGAIGSERRGLGSPVSLGDHGWRMNTMSGVTGRPLRVPTERE